MNRWLGATATLALEPALATSWEQTSPTVWRFHLRPGVKWQDGSPFTAEDVVFTLKRIQSPNSSMRAPMSPVKEARRIDDLTVEFETLVPDPIFLQEQTNLLIMSKAWCEAHNAAEPVMIGKEDNYALHQCDGHRTVQAGVAGAGPQDGGGKEPAVVGQAGA